MDERAELLDILREKSYRTGRFELASGKVSDYYLDCKLTTLSSPRGRQLACRLMYQYVRAMVPRPQAIGGLTIGAAPLSLGISDLALKDGWELPVFVVRDEQKNHGTKKMVEGTVPPAGSTVVVVDDVMTTGMSIMKAIVAVEAHDAKVAKVIVLVDREEGGNQTLANYDVESIFSYKDLPR
jgi:orotate phosphoribosyltransferase